MLRIKINQNMIK